MKAPFPYFGGKSLAAELLWEHFDDVKNYVEPFCGSAAVLLNAPNVDFSRTETINDMDGFICNFWRAIAKDPELTAYHTDWMVNETDLFARHIWLVRQKKTMQDRLEADPEWFDAKIAGWWCWGVCNWIGHGFCSGKGPWVHDGEKIVDARNMPHLGNAGEGVKRKLPHLSKGRGVIRQLPHLGNAGRGVIRQLPHLGNAGRGVKRTEFILTWFNELHDRMRDVRVTCGDWKRVLGDSCTVKHGLTGVFLDPPYETGDMDYANGGMNQGISADVRKWCIENGNRNNLKIAVCGYKNEHDELLNHGWFAKQWQANKGYARTENAKENYKGETIWLNKNCKKLTFDLF